MALPVGTAQSDILNASVTAVSAHRRTDTIEPLLIRDWLPAVPVAVLLADPARCRPARSSSRTIARHPIGQSMRWAMWPCFAWRRCHCLRSLSRLSPRAGRRALPGSVLRRLFAFCLAAVAVRMLLRA